METVRNTNYITYIFLFLSVIGYTGILMYNIFDPTISGILTQLVFVFLFVSPLSNMANTASKHNINLAEFVHSSLFSKMLLEPLMRMILLLTVISIGFGLCQWLYAWLIDTFGRDSTVVTIASGTGNVVGGIVAFIFLYFVIKKALQILATPIAVAKVSSEKDLFMLSLVRISIVGVSFFSLLIHYEDTYILYLNTIGLLPLSLLFLEHFSFGRRAINERGKEIETLLSEALGVQNV